MNHNTPPRTECEEFRRRLGAGLTLDSAEQSRLDVHEAACGECRKFRANLSVIDRIGGMASKARLRPAVDAHERLRASWQHLAVRTSWRDWAKYWFAYEIEPKIMRPLMPHAAMITGFIFFSLSLIQVQINTGWLTPRPVAERRFQLVEAEAAAEDLTLAYSFSSEVSAKSGELRIDMV